MCLPRQCNWITCLCCLFQMIRLVQCHWMKCTLLNDYRFLQLCSPTKLLLSYFLWKDFCIVVYICTELLHSDSPDSLNSMVLHDKLNSISWLEGSISLFGFLHSPFMLKWLFSPVVSRWESEEAYVKDHESKNTGGSTKCQFFCMYLLSHLSSRVGEKALPVVPACVCIVM